MENLSLVLDLQWTCKFGLRIVMISIQKLLFKGDISMVFLFVCLFVKEVRGTWVSIGASWSLWETVTAEGVLPMQSARQSQGANQDRARMAQPEWVALTDFIFSGEREPLPKGKSLMSKIGTYKRWAKPMPGVASLPLRWLLRPFKWLVQGWHLSFMWLKFRGWILPFHVQRNVEKTCVFLSAAVDGEWDSGLLSNSPRNVQSCKNSEPIWEFSAINNIGNSEIAAGRFTFKCFS